MHYLRICLEITFNLQLSQCFFRLLSHEFAKTYISNLIERNVRVAIKAYGGSVKVAVKFVVQQLFIEPCFCQSLSSNP